MSNASLPGSGEDRQQAEGRHHQWRPSVRSLAIVAILALAPCTLAGQALAKGKGGGGRGGVPAPPRPAPPPPPPAAAGAATIAVLKDSSGLELSAFPAGDVLTATLKHAGGASFSATGAADASGALNVNPGSCWTRNTPRIVAGDTVTVADASGVRASMVVQNVRSGAPVQLSATTVAVHGSAKDPAGAPLGAAGLDVRLISNGGNFAETGTKRLRAVNPPGTLTAPDASGPGGVTGSWTFTRSPASDMALALAGSARLIWATPDATQVTIAEAGVTAGPAVGCTAPLEP